MKVVAIVPAAGRGVRFRAKALGRRDRKPFALLANKPILIHTINALESSSLIDCILVIVHPDDTGLAKETIKRYRIKKVKHIISGGRTRTHSVYNGLKHMDEDADIVLIHDGVRPFITEEIIKTAIKGAKEYGSAVCGVQTISTMKEVDDKLFITSTLNRKRLYDIQTPQVFKRDIILKAYEEAIAKGCEATDDSVLVERIGYKVKLTAGSHYNIKITTPEDMVFAEAIYARRGRLRYSSAGR